MASRNSRADLGVLPQRVGEALALVSPGLNDAYGALEFIEGHYTNEQKGTALAAFLGAREVLEPEIVSHVLRIRTSRAVVVTLLKRFDDLEADIQARLLARSDAEILAHVTANKLLNKAPVETQQAWAKSPELERRLAVLSDSEISEEVRNQAVEGLAEMVLKRPKASVEVIQNLYDVLGSEATFDIIYDERFDTLSRYRVLFSKMFEQPERLALSLREWAAELESCSPFNNGQIPDGVEPKQLIEDLYSGTNPWYHLWNLGRKAAEVCGERMAETSQHLWDMASEERGQAKGVAWLETLAELSLRCTPAVIGDKLDADLAERSKQSERARLLESASLEEIADLLAKEPLTVEDERILTHRFGRDDAPAYRLWEELDQLMEAKASKTPELGEYWRVRVIDDHLRTRAIPHLRVEDLAELAGFGQTLVLADPAELIAYLEENQVQLRDVLALWRQVGNLSMAEAVTILR